MAAKTPRSTVPTSISLTPEDQRLLKILAEREHRSVSGQFRYMIERMVREARLQEDAA